METLAGKLGLQTRTVINWFHNHRMRIRYKNTSSSSSLNGQLTLSSDSSSSNNNNTNLAHQILDSIKHGHSLVHNISSASFKRSASSIAKGNFFEYANSKTEDEHDDDDDDVADDDEDDDDDGEEVDYDDYNESLKKNEYEISEMMAMGYEKDHDSDSNMNQSSAEMSSLYIPQTGDDAEMEEDDEEEDEDDEWHHQYSTNASFTQPLHDENNNNSSAKANKRRKPHNPQKLSVQEKTPARASTQLTGQIEQN